METIGERDNEAKRHEQVTLEKDGGDTWQGQSLETPDAKVDNKTIESILDIEHNQGSDQTVRRYDIALPPFPKGAIIPTDKVILQHHVGNILAMLWKDGWDQAGDIKTVKSKDNKIFHVFVPAKRLGTRAPIAHNQKPLKLNKNPYVRNRH